MDDLHGGLDNLERILHGSERPGQLKLSVLSHITENFSDEREIGTGGCGNVYKGILPSGQLVAVKKLFSSKTTDERMFQQEVTTMMSVEHPNIVRFIGYCSHTEQQAMQITRKYILADQRKRLLCFEYIGNGTLGDHLTDELRGLEWHKRFQIIKGICEGLHHLKEKNIIHMDLKPANILLNDDLVPKITDFGISRPGEITKTVSENYMYTPVYCAPEYQFNREMSFKSDIYSLGAIVIEMVTGTRNNSPPDITIVCRRWRHRWNKLWKHTTLLGWQQQVTRCLELAQRCRNQNPTERPDIQDIICELSEMDSTCMDISDCSISTVEQKKSFLDDMLGIEPLELHFSGPISHSIQLTNDTDDYIAFRIPLEEENMDFGFSATRRLPFCLHPTKDIVPPRSSRSVTIKLEALKKPLQEHGVAKLCVESARVDKGLTTKDITTDMFKEEPDKMVDVVNLMVSVRAPKQVLVVEPLEFRYYQPVKPNKLLLPCLLQLTNRTDENVAFTLILQQGKVHNYQTMGGTGIVSPCSTWGVVIDMLVEEEAVAETMQCKDTCLLRSVVVDADLRVDDVSVEFFNEPTGVHEMELDIVFAEQPQALSPLISPLSFETELLHINPAELRFADVDGVECISLTNKTEDDIIYVINTDERRDIRILGSQTKYCGEVPPHSTRVVTVRCWRATPPSRVGVMMISGSSRYRTANDLIGSYNREELMNQVREEGGKAHEALLACFVGAPHPEHEVSVRAPKQLLVVEPLELRYYRPIEPNKLLPCLLQLTNRTDDYVAFALVLPQGSKVLYYQAMMGTGIVPPCSTWGVVIDMLVEEEAVAETMQCKDTCLVRSVVVNKFLSGSDVSVEFFNQQTGVHEIELDIMFAEQPQALSPLISPLSFETELLHICPVELRFADIDGPEYISLTNKTDDDIIYVINTKVKNGITIKGSKTRSGLFEHSCYGGVTPHSTCVLSVRCWRGTPPRFRVGVMMISGSSRYRTVDDFIGGYNRYNRVKLMNQVREEGGKAHEALLACSVGGPPHPEHEVPEHETVVLRMDENDLEQAECMDVHPKEPWVVTGHFDGTVCVWKMDPKTSAYQTVMTSSLTRYFIMVSVKFIARMQWVACGDSDGYITVFTFADNKLTEIKKFQAEEGHVHALAVHPSLPYLLSSSEASNSIQLWDWDQGWMCTRKFSSQYNVLEMTFNPKDANTFASLDKGGEISIWSIDSQGRPTTYLSEDTVHIAYCNAGIDLQCNMATIYSKGKNTKIEILDLRANTTTHVHALEMKRVLRHGCKIACHPTRPLLATACDSEAFLWNYTTHRLKGYDGFGYNGIGFIDIEGFQRLVIAKWSEIKLVNILI